MKGIGSGGGAHICGRYLPVGDHFDTAKTNHGPPICVELDEEIDS